MATVAKPTAPTRQIGTPPMVPRIAPREDLNPFRIAQIQFDMAAEFLKLDPGLRQICGTQQCPARPRKGGHPFPPHRPAEKGRALAGGETGKPPPGNVPFGGAK